MQNIVNDSQKTLLLPPVAMILWAINIFCNTKELLYNITFWIVRRFALL